MNDKPKLTEEQMDEVIELVRVNTYRSNIKKALIAAGYGETLIEKARRLRCIHPGHNVDDVETLDAYEVAYEEEHRLRLEAEKRNEGER